jgi:hypothetical protein
MRFLPQFPPICIGGSKNWGCRRSSDAGCHGALDGGCGGLVSSNKKNGLFWLTQVYRLTPAKQRQALRRLGCGGLRWLWRKPWRVGFLLDAVGRVTSQVTSEKAFFLWFAPDRFAVWFAPKRRYPKGWYPIRYPLKTGLLRPDRKRSCSPNW